MVIRHIQGSDNVVADARSRMEMIPLLTGTPPVTDFPRGVVAREVQVDQSNYLFYKKKHL